MLIIFGGLPGTGKTTLARELARAIGAVHLRIDSIEQAILNSGLMAPPINEAGYFAAYAIAEDNLRIGRTVISDSVNSLAATRDAWLEIAARIPVGALEVEVVCSNVDEHRRRVETRVSDVHGLKLPAWRDVLLREYQAWEREHIVVDTAGRGVEENVQALATMIRDC